MRVDIHHQYEVDEQKTRWSAVFKNTLDTKIMQAWSLDELMIGVKAHIQRVEEQDKKDSQ